LARRYAYQVLLVDELHRAGVEIVFLNRQIGASPEDDLLLQVQGMVAEYERAKIMERSRRGKQHAAKRGSLNVLAGAPYGYRYLGKHDGGGVARYEIVEDQARVVRQVFEWVGCERASIGEVCRRLRQQGSPTASGKPVWDRTTVWAMLRNPAYKGEAAFGKTRVGSRPARPRPVRGGSEQPRRAYGLYDAPAEDWITIPVPRLVDPALFDAVGEQLAENRRRSRQSSRGARYLLQGLLVCRLCGYAYYGKAISLRAAKGKQRDYAYYRCCGSDAYRFGGQRVCSNPQLRTDRLEEAVWHEVERLLHDPRRIATEYTRRLDEARRKGTDGADLAAAEAQVAKLRRGMGRLIDGYADGLIERAEFEPRLMGFRQRIKGWDKQIQAMRDEAAWQATLSLVIGRLEDFAQRVRERMSKVDWHMQRELIRLLVKRVEIDHDNVNVVFRIDSAPPMPDPTNPERDSFWQDCGRGEQPRAGQFVPALCVRSVDDTDTPGTSMVSVCRRRAGTLPERTRGTGRHGRASGPLGGVPPGDASDKDQDRLLQGWQPQGKLCQPGLRLPGVRLSATPGEELQTGQPVLELHARGQPGGAHRHAGDDPEDQLAQQDTDHAGRRRQ
jgi:site-specific DNA recombinase